MATQVRVGDGAITIEQLCAVARDRREVVLTDAARERVSRARAVVERAAQGATPVYGVNTALGANTGQPIAVDDLDAYQRRAVRARAVGIGEPYDTASVRAMLFARVAGMAAGGSGVSPHVLDSMVALLNRKVHPIVPRIGSISVADLPQLSHLALPLIGEGLAEVNGEILAGADALARAGLAPVKLGAKDGIALISANAATVARAALVADDATRLLDSWLAAVALTCEGFRANLSPLDSRAIAARPARGQEHAAQRLGELLHGSALHAPNAARRVQDPLSLRVVAQVHGAAHWLCHEAREQIEIELNSAAESPLVIAHDDIMLSNGNFHVPALALTLDALAMALAQVTSLAVQRCQRMMAPAFTGLPLQLTRHGPAHSGFATIQKTLTALWARVRHLANPASLDFFPVSEGVEDHATFALQVAEKLGELVANARYVVAIELMIGAQALDLRGPGTTTSLGVGARAAHERVRERIEALDQDRPLGPDADSLEAAVRDGRFAGLGRAT